ncbi:MAG: CPBP family intramembrane metalloprotease [Gloeocapsa sp. DLM2.Bin57]|nr:MAG: CPBP family intramembrane metalloprotease [Gloeocapsa sp. DLM2.Bin57]
MIKRIFLIVITILVAINLIDALFSSLNQPQVQNRLQVYQSELILQASSYQTDSSIAKTRDSLLGDNIYGTVQQQYQKALEETQQNSQILKGQENNQNQVQLQQVLSQLDSLDQELKLKLGILEAYQGDTETAIATWSSLSNNEIATILTDLWQENSDYVATDTDAQKVQAELSGWFEYITLTKLYQQTGNETAIASLAATEQEAAKIALIKLGLIALTPFLGVISGILLLVLLLIQWLQQGKEALLSQQQGYRWSVPWGGETIWQVLIVGFFFVGQFILPFAFSLTGLNPTNASVEIKAVYVLVSYLSMAFAGLLVLYLSIRPFRPFPENWFNFSLQDNWILWGIGGYIAAFPLVLLVSLLNQQLWQGQGGSNPLILLALESQNTIALLIFFSTAAIAAPIFEEIMFRGFLLTSLTRYLNSWSAILLSGFIFAAVHLSLSEVLPLTVLGIVLGFVYTRSRNLLSSILLHALWNSGTLLSLYILGS